ncbi:MAG: F0F1 ATP synthase subunit delta, partial [Aquincola sp.]|nr:F0F1 ATP synthase subunit delta [Aquincola sp.]
MAELATIARPYAEALFKAGGGAPEAEQVNMLARVASDARMRQFADNPKVSEQQVFELIGAVTK